jgi:molecular chaperone DnaK
MGKIIGIDLGTTNSVVSVMEGGEPTVITSSEGGRLIPSVVAVNPKTGERMVGQVARRQAITNSDNTLFSVKRFMGRKFDDPEVQRALQYVPYKVSSDVKGELRVHMNGKEYSPQEVSAMILAKLKNDAEAYLGESVTQAVITVPAYFNDTQRQATKDAGRIAGLEVLRIINEPTASSLAYGLEKQSEETIAVFDLGGGTFDVSILDVGDGVFEVRATNGNTHLGGDDFDVRVVEWITDNYSKDQGINLNEDKQALQRIREAAEKAKVELSTLMQTEINLPFITADANGPQHLNYTLSRAKLEELTEDLIEQCIKPVEIALEDARLSVADVDEVVLVGGMTRMPGVQEAVRKFFNCEPNKKVNPDEVVAIGAAIQAGVLGGDVKDVLLLDVTPLTLSIETLGGIATALIERNTTVPTTKSQVFSTASDNQSAVEIHVIQGERSMAADNKSLGKFILDSIPPAARGTPQIEVTFDIDADGILSVSAKDKASNRSQNITIQGSSGLSDTDIANMIASAENYSEEDRQRKEIIEVHNAGNSVLHRATRVHSELNENIDVEVRQNLQYKIDELQETLTGEDLTSIRESTSILQQEVERITVMISQLNEVSDDTENNISQPESGSDEKNQTSPDSDSDVVDGNFTEV